MRGRRVTGGWWAWIAAALVLVAALAGLAALFLPRLVEMLAVARLESAGIPAASLRVADLGWTRAEITDLRLGGAGELTVGEAVIDYTPLGLLSGRVDRLLLRDFRLALDLDGPGPPLGSLNALLGGRAGGGAGASLPEVRIETGRLALSTQAGPLAIPIAGELLPRPEGGLRARMTIPVGRVEGAGLAADSLGGELELALEPEGELTLSAHLGVAKLAGAGTMIETGSLDLRLSGRFDGLAGTMRVAAGMPKLATAGLRARDVALDAEAEIAFAEGRLTAKLRDGSRLSTATLALPGLLVIDGPVRLPLAATEEPSLTVDFAAPRGLRIGYALTAGPVALAARLRPDAPRPVAVGGRLSALSLAGAWSEAEGNQATIRLTASELAQRADPAPFAPLNLEADGRLSGSRIDFTLRASAAGKRAVLTVAGHHDLRGGAGAAKVKLPPVAFSPGGLEPADLAPVLKGRIEQATGAVALAGDLSWSAEQGLAPDLRLLLKDLSFSAPQATVSRLNGVVRLDSLRPLSTPPDQTFAVGLIDVGVPLTDGLVTFRLDPGGMLVVNAGRLRFAGGTVAVEPVVIDLAAPEIALRLVVTDVDLRDLLALADIDGLSATGRLDGEIPLRLGGNGVVIDGGELHAEAPGRLSYDPAHPPAALQGQGETVSLLLAALTDFEYRALRLTVDRDSGGEMAVAAHIEGKNPNFYDGYPVELNFNISGKLDQILHRGLVGYRIPDAIRKRLSEFPD